MPDGEFLILRTDALDNAEDQLRLSFDRAACRSLWVAPKRRRRSATRPRGAFA
jgi:hypothetical protein